MEGQELRKQVAKGVGIVFIFQLLNRFFSFLFKIFLQRFLTPFDFGIIAITEDLINVVNQFGNIGLDQTVTIVRADEQKILETCYRIRILVGIAIYFVIFLVAPMWAGYFNVQEVEWTTRVLGLNCLIAAFGFAHFFYFIRNIRFGIIETISFLGLLANIACAVIMVFLKFEFWSMIIGGVLSVIVISVLSILLCPIKIGIRFDKHIAKKIVSLGKYFLLIAILTLLIHSMGNWFILKEIGVRELGMFSVAFFWGNFVPIHILGMVLKVITPAFAIASEDVERVKVGYADCVKIVSIIIFPISIGFVLVSEKFVKVVIGHQWTSIIIPLILLNIYGLLRAFSSLNGTILGAIGKPKFPSFTGMIHLLILFVSLLFVTKKFGIIGVAYSILFCGLVANILLWIFISINVRFELKKILLGILKCALCCLLMAIFVHFVMYLIKNDTLALIISVLGGALIYVSSTFIFIRTEVNLLVNILKKALTH